MNKLTEIDIKLTKLIIGIYFFRFYFYFLFKKINLFQFRFQILKIKKSSETN